MGEGAGATWGPLGWGPGGGFLPLLDSGAPLLHSQMRETLERSYQLQLLATSFNCFQSIQQSLYGVLTLGRGFGNILVNSLVLQTKRERDSCNHREWQSWVWNPDFSDPKLSLHLIFGDLQMRKWRPRLPQPLLGAVKGK